MPLRWVNGDPKSRITQAWSGLKNSWNSRIEQRAQSLAEEIEAWMKQNAPWHDITGAARASLYAEAKHVTWRTTTIMLGYGEGIDYGFWLETIQFGRYSIIGPAMDHFGERFFLEMQSILTNPRTGEEIIS